MNTLPRAIQKRRLLLLATLLLALVACSPAAVDQPVEVPAPQEPAEAAAPQADYPSTLPSTEAPSAAETAAVAESPPAGVASIPLKDALDTLQPRDVFANFYDITQIPRPSGHLDGIRAFLVDFGEGLGLETVVDQAGNVIIRRPAAPGLEDRPGVVLQAHMDMVPQADRGKDFDFTTDPIEALVSGDTIVANGTTLGADDGIGMAMIMAVLQSDSLEAGPIEGLFTVDEETTMSGINGLQPDALEGTILINLDSETEGEFTIGSAGGQQAAVQATYPQTAAPAGGVAYLLNVQGLAGGHSGVDIHRGRGNAIKILVRLLKEADAQFDLQLADLTGGTAPNAIPREASALVVLDEAQEADFLNFVADFESTVRAELSAVEPDLTIQANPDQLPDQVMDDSFRRMFLDAMHATPQGVMRMSDAVPGLVETSTNLGIANVQDGNIDVQTLQRSSVDSSLVDTSQMVASVWDLAGYPVEFSGSYNGWNPDPNSPILGIMKDVYLDLYGREANVGAVHAGLECGVVGGIYPDMDMISIGPTLSGVHSPSETLTISTVDEVMALLTGTLQRVGEGS